MLTVNNYILEINNKSSFNKIPVFIMLKSYYRENIIEAGCDEAGRGCLAGPVFAAAVILPKNFSHTLINDSKKLTENTRLRLREEIQEEAISWSVEMVDNNIIDQINILNASIQAMFQAIDSLTIKPQYLLIDGNRFKPYPSIPHQCFIKGDSRFLSIAAASILAKTYRDEYMKKLHKKYSNYGWDRNKGYPTKLHRDAISRYGITPHHRKSFTLINTQMEIFIKEGSSFALKNQGY